ncbi:MAG: efflux RND transporter permease subunit [Patescibacteria group bacterium]|jgi:HAE1 family hydrophobic/amphiphilic exporter-1
MAQKKITYLDKLKFDPKLLGSFFGRYLQNKRLALLVVLAFVFLGVSSLIRIPRNLNPEVKIPYVIVSTVLPGAGPKDIESLVTVPVENAVKRIKGINNYESSSQENVSVVSLEFAAGTDPSKARDEVQRAVDSIGNFPSDVQDPSVTDIDFEDVPVWTFALTNANGGEVSSLMRLADRLKDAIEDISKVDRVELSGYDTQEIYVRAHPTEMREKGIDPFGISQALKNAAGSFPAGNLEVGNYSYPLNVEQTINTVSDIRSLQLRLNGQVIALGDVTTVEERSKPDLTLSYSASRDHQARPVVIFSVYRTRSAKINETVSATREKLEEVLSPYKKAYVLDDIQDYSKLIDDQFFDLYNNFLQTIALVFISMLLLFGARMALVASLAIPLTLLILFSVMEAAGLTLNFLSFFSLLIALGLFVDNNVVIVQGYASLMRSKKFTSLEAGLLVWKDYFIDLFSINLVTIWAFLPLLLATGIIGEFIKPIPIIVSAAMMSSVLVAFLFTLPATMFIMAPVLPQRLKVLLGLIGAIAAFIVLITVIPPSPLYVFTLCIGIVLCIISYLFRQSFWDGLKARFKTTSVVRVLVRRFRLGIDEGFISMHAISERYRTIIDVLLATRNMRLKTLAIVIVFSVISYLLVPLGLVENEFFPKADEDYVYVQVELPAGTNRTKMKAVALNLLEQFRFENNVKTVYARIGSRVQSGFSGGGSSSNILAYTFELEDKATRSENSVKFAQRLRKKYAAFSEGSLQVVEASSGPPVGSDVQIKLLGNDLNVLQNYAQKTQKFLQDLPGTVNVDRSIKSGVPKLTFVPDKTELSEHGISESQIGFSLRTFASGFTLGKVTLNDKELNVVYRMFETVPSPEDIGILHVNSTQGPIPLTELGEITLSNNPTVITRENGQRTISVTAGALPGYNPTILNKSLVDYADNRLKMEKGYSWQTGGSNEENAKSVQSILNAMAISAILIMATMVIQLGSFRKAFIVMLVIPLAVSGVFLWFALTGTPLSFPALIGTLALFGIVVANSILIVEKINKNLAAGIPEMDAISEAGASRLEPIALTSISQIIGLIPITLSDPLWRGLGGAIIAGLTFSGIIMLFFIPIVYYYLFPRKSGRVLQ